MSDGAYRDDHEAAVARAEALDRELAQARTERDAARVERDLLRDRLWRAARASELPPLPPPRRRASPASLAGGVSALTVGLIAAAVATSRMEPPRTRLQAVAVTLPSPSASAVTRPGLATCLDLARDVDGDVMREPGRRICMDIIASAATDARLSELSHHQLQDLGRAFADWSIAAERLALEHTADAARSSARAAREVYAAATRVDLDLVPY